MREMALSLDVREERCAREKKGLCLVDLGDSYHDCQNARSMSRILAKRTRRGQDRTRQLQLIIRWSTRKMRKITYHVLTSSGRPTSNIQFQKLSRGHEFPQDIRLWSAALSSVSKGLQTGITRPTGSRRQILKTKAVRVERKVGYNLKDTSLRG